MQQTVPSKHRTPRPVFQKPATRPVDRRGVLTSARVVASVVRGLVDHPSLVRTEIHETPHQVTFVLRVAPSDMPLVIGRSGRTANALRSLLVRFRILDQRKYRLAFKALRRSLC